MLNSSSLRLLRSRLRGAVLRIAGLPGRGAWCAGVVRPRWVVRSHWVAAVAAVAAVVLCCGALLAAPPPAAAVEVGGDDLRDAYIGSGSVLLPGSVPAPERRTAADCPGCSWRADLLCTMVSASACRGQSRMCRSDEGWYRFYVAVGGGPWRMVGSGCVGPCGPQRPEDYARVVADQVVLRLPPLRPGVQPRQALAGVPVVAWSGQPRVWQGFMEVLGKRVRVRATAQWVWTFDDERMTSAVPGGRWPDRSVSHTFVVPGEQQVEVAAVWRATYLLEGIGPLPVEGVITQRGLVPVAVHSARAVLVR